METHAVDQWFEEYLRLRNERDSGRKPQRMTVFVSVCCHRPCYTERSTGWDLCSACHRRTYFAEVPTGQVLGSHYDRWKKVHVRGSQLAGRVNQQEQWLCNFLDRWIVLSHLFEHRPSRMTKKAWEESLLCWELLLQLRFGSRERVAEALQLTPAKVRYRVERAREIIMKRLRRMGGGRREEYARGRRDVRRSRAHPSALG